MGCAYRLDWTRPVAQADPGEHHYHATDGVQHILVMVTEEQLHLALRLAISMRQRDPAIMLQDALEEAIAAALERRPSQNGALRLRDSDFD